MTQEELIKEIKQLSLAEREAVINEISLSIRQEEEADREEKMAAFYRLQAMLKTESPPPTDEELRDDYTNYLAEKYS
jgi:hypothetical protein